MLETLFGNNPDKMYRVYLGLGWYDKGVEAAQDKRTLFTGDPTLMNIFNFFRSSPEDTPNEFPAGNVNVVNAAFQEGDLLKAATLLDSLVAAARGNDGRLIPTGEFSIFIFSRLLEYLGTTFAEECTSSRRFLSPSEIENRMGQRFAPGTRNFRGYLNCPAFGVYAPGKSGISLLLMEDTLRDGHPAYGGVPDAREIATSASSGIKRIDNTFKSPEQAAGTANAFFKEQVIPTYKLIAANDERLLEYMAARFVIHRVGYHLAQTSAMIEVQPGMMAFNPNSERSVLFLRKPYQGPA